MIVRGTVVSVNNNVAIVSVPRTLACSHSCESCGGCTQPQIDIHAVSLDNVKAGNIVLVDFPTNPDYLQMFFVYLLPVVLMIGAAVAFESIFGELVGMLLGMVAAVIGFAIAKAADNAYKKRKPKAHIKTIL